MREMDAEFRGGSRARSGAGAGTIGAVSVAQFGADGIAEEVHERADDGRHASADDAKISFQAGPEANVVVMVCCIRVLPDGSQVCQANDTACSHEEAKKEGKYDTSLALLVPYLKLHKLRDWEEEDNEIEEDIGSTVDVRGQPKIVAVAFVFAIPLVPEIADRSALEDEVDDEGQKVYE